MSVYPVGATVRSSAVLSECGTYRYRLMRRWGPGIPLPFVMLNPSTADAVDDDPTIRRCVGFARSFGYDGIAVWNLYAFRAPKPPEVWRAQRAGVDVVGGLENDRRLRNLFAWAAAGGWPVIAAWGADARADRTDQVLAMPYAGEVLHHLGLTAAGVPRHPLMLRGDAQLARLTIPGSGDPAPAAVS